MSIHDSMSERFGEIIDGLEAEIDRLHGLLRETIPFINDAGNDEDPEAQARANDLFVRVADALARPVPTEEKS